MGKSTKTSSTAKASSSKPATGKVVAKAAKTKTATIAKSAPASKPAPAKKPVAKAAPAKPAPAPVKVVAKTTAKPIVQTAAKAVANGSAKAPVKEVAVPIKYKCPFPSDEISKWRQVLLERRAEISGDIAGLVKDAMEAEDGHTTPNHIAERGSDADLQDLSLGVAGEEKDVVWQIDRALRKIDDLKPLPFGLCEFTKEMIPRTRLQLIPWTPLSIEGATHMEKSNLELEDLLVDD